MKKGLNLKRMLSVALSLCLLLSTCVLGTVTALAADEPQDFVVEHNHDGWTAWHGESTDIVSGNYYLDGDFTLTNVYNIKGEVTLCLSGHTITLGENYFYIEEDATLTLTDCTDDGVITEGTTTPVYVNGGTFIMENGTISGTISDAYGGGVYVSGGTFTMKGGLISGNNVKFGGGVYVNGGTFTMEGGTISGNTAHTVGFGGSYGGGVYIEKDSTFTMERGEISENNAKYGCGVYMEYNSSFTMQGGSISDNTATSNGGGLYVGSGSTFTMENGTISHNNAGNSGGGVFMNGLTGDAVFILKDGTISGNYAKSDGGGISTMNSSIVIMEGGKIFDNSAGSIGGGGVYLSASRSIFTMKDGEISENSATYKGGGVYLERMCSFTMENGKISGNRAPDGGGVYLQRNRVTFTMENGMISDNNATNGGGVYMNGLSGDPVFTMKGGSISGNSAEKNGGGVYLERDTTVFTMENGTISENRATSNGGGVYVDAGVFNASGSSVVAGNTLSDETTESNISLVNATTYINVIEELTDGAQLGVNRVTDVKATPVLTQCYSEYHTDDAGKYFFYDNAESFGNCDVGTGPDGETWFGYNVTFKDKSGNTLEEQFVGYNCTAMPIDDNCWSTEIGGEEFDFDTPITENLILYSDSETILYPMSSQIRFQRNADGSYANKFDIRTRAKITDEDFAKYIAETNEVAVQKISKVGFVYACNSTDFSIADAQRVAKGETVSGYKDAPVSYIQDADGYYMFTCIITDIHDEDIPEGVTACAYICVEDKWYFYNAETTVIFKDLYDANYPQAAEEYGW